MLHEIKVTVDDFNAIISGAKTSEIAEEYKTESGKMIVYQTGDIIRFREVENESYTGRSVMADVKNVSSSEHLNKDCRILSIMVKGMNYIQGIPVMLFDEHSKPMENKLDELSNMFWKESDFMDTIDKDIAMNCVEKWLGLI